MATSKEYIYDVFSNKITDYTYLSYTDEEMIREFDRFLESAKGRFYSCDKLNLYNEMMEEFTESFDYDEIEILTEIMVLLWIERQIQDVSKFKDRLASKDYQVFSKANMLDKITASKKDKSMYVDKLMGVYGNKKIINKIRR